MRHDSSKFDQFKGYIAYAIYFFWVFYAKLDEKLVIYNYKYCKKYTKKLTTKYPKKWYIFIKRLVGVQCMGYKLQFYNCKV